jgi:hypothetical protein
MIYLARTYDPTKGRYWVLFDSERTLRGAVGESRASLRRRWEAAHGKLAPRSVTRFAGLMRPSELPMQIAEERRPAKPEG